MNSSLSFFFPSSSRYWETFYMFTSVNIKSLHILKKISGEREAKKNIGTVFCVCKFMWVKYKDCVLIAYWYGFDVWYPVISLSEWIYHRYAWFKHKWDFSSRDCYFSFWSTSCAWSKRKSMFNEIVLNMKDLWVVF